MSTCKGCIHLVRLGKPYYVRSAYTKNLEAETKHGFWLALLTRTCGKPRIYYEARRKEAPCCYKRLSPS